MALSESGSSVQVGQIAYGSAGHHKIVKAKKSPAPSSLKIRKGGKQSLYVRPRRSR